MLHAAGAVSQPRDPGEPPAAPFCANRMAPDSVYQELRNRGIEHGPLFRTLVSLYTSEREAIGEIFTTNSTNSPLRPELLDGALQTIAGLTLHQGGPLLPFRWRKSRSSLRCPTAAAFTRVRSSRCISM